MYNINIQQRFPMNRQNTIKIINDAIDALQKIELDYQNHHRVVEPHSFGKRGDQNELQLHVFQTGGGSSSSRLDWKYFNLKEMTNLKPTGINFSVRQDHNPRAKNGFKVILNEVQPRPIPRP